MIVRTADLENPRNQRPRPAVSLGTSCYFWWKCPASRLSRAKRLPSNPRREHMRPYSDCVPPRGAWMSLLAIFALFAQPALAAADEARPNRIQIEYVAPRNADHQELYEFLRQRRALEKLQEIFSPVRLPGDLTLRMLGCDGVSNAWYQRSVVSVCYEYIREIYQFAPRETTASGITPRTRCSGSSSMSLPMRWGTQCTTC